MGDEAAVAALARALGDQTRIRLVDQLAAGEATVSDLAARLGLEQPRISSHLAVLREAGLVAVRARGRQRAYALGSEAASLAVAVLRSLAEAPPPRSRAARRAVMADAPIRRARTCYDHLAGVAGVAMMESMLERGWLERVGERDLGLTAAGEAGLAAAGVDLAGARRARRSFAVSCLDWTERRFHLGGALGAALLAAQVRSGRAQVRPDSRLVRLEASPWPA